jgi:protease IV
MALTSDTLLERLYLKRQIHFWRICTLAVVAVFTLYTVEHANNISPVAGKFIARFAVEGMISDDVKREKLLKSIAEDENIQAVIVRIDSPGGTAVGGESLYTSLKDIAKIKPVVAVCRTICTSAGYMTALASHHIIVQDSSITGSIGVLLQAAEFSEMASKLGVTPITIKSSPNKAVPLPTEKLLPEQRVVLQSVIDDFYGIFVEMVSKARNLKDAELKAVTDGRIFTGRQAKQLKLVDAIGGEQEALDWLKKEKNIDSTLDIRDMEVENEKESLVEKLSAWTGLNFLSQHGRNQLDGLMLIWQPVDL